MSLRQIIAVLAILLSAVLVVKKNGADADDIGTNFFLKASKSVPRIGRRSMDFDNYFLKASKSVPRIGRRMNVPDIGSLPEKKFYADKYFPDSGSLGNSWGSVDHKDYGSIMVGDEPYRESPEQLSDSFWQRVRKSIENEETRHQALV